VLVVLILLALLVQKDLAHCKDMAEATSLRAADRHTLREQQLLVLVVLFFGFEQRVSICTFVGVKRRYLYFLTFTSNASREAGGGWNRGSGVSVFVLLYAGQRVSVFVLLYEVTEHLGVQRSICTFVLLSKQVSILASIGKVL
jgi:hypothetical protein